MIKTDENWRPFHISGSNPVLSNEKGSRHALHARHQSHASYIFCWLNTKAHCFKTSSPKTWKERRNRKEQISAFYSNHQKRNFLFCDWEACARRIRIERACGWENLSHALDCRHPVPIHSRLWNRSKVSNVSDRKNSTRSLNS